MIAGNLSTQEIKEQTDALVLVPFGSFEQHGPYLPLLTDSIIAEEISKKVEAAMPEKILLYPTIWFGDSAEHDGFPGTLSVTAFDLMKTLENLFLWLEKSNFKKGILYNAHGGNVNLANTICEEFSRVHTFKIKSIYANSQLVKECAKKLFGAAETHAGSTEISLVYYLRPELKKMTETKIINKTPYHGGGKLALLPLKQISNNGILQSNKTIEIDVAKGKELSSAMVSALSESVETMLNLRL